MVEKDLKDVFGSYLLEDAEFDGYYDIPYVDTKNIEFPDALVPFSKLNKENDNLEKGTYCCFYQHDYQFDGKYGIWNSLIQNKDFARGFSFEKLKGVSGIIAPDYSLYGDFPRCWQIAQVYRSHTVGYRLSRLGFNVIPNVRWTDTESYDYAFLGCRKHSIVAVGTVGCLRSKADYSMFMNGFSEMINRLEPLKIVIYGSVSDEMIQIMNRNNIQYKIFQSQISKAHEVKKNGNEI